MEVSGFHLDTVITNLLIITYSERVRTIASLRGRHLLYHKSMGKELVKMQQQSFVG